MGRYQQSEGRDESSIHLNAGDWVKGATSKTVGTGLTEGLHDDRKGSCIYTHQLVSV